MVGVIDPALYTVPTGSSAKGSNPIDTDYSFGNLVSGKGAANQQASNQWLLDEAERKFNSAEAQKQRDFEYMLSSTAYQRAAQDMTAAGLNPWLMAQGSSTGAASPTSAFASSNAGGATQANSRLGNIGTAAFGIAALIKTVAKFVK